MYENSINVKDQFLKLTAWVLHTPISSKRMRYAPTKNVQYLKQTKS